MNLDNEVMTTEQPAILSYKQYRKKRWFSLFIKRIFDFVCAFFAIILLFPIWLILPIVIKADSKGSVLFRQERLGLNGKTFKIWKYRTMITNAESIGGGIFLRENDDVRITKVGKFLRKISLDELPQLFNILGGSMSFIGPRPPVTYHPHKIEDYSDIQRQRFYVKPGMSGLAQIKVRESVDWDEKIKYDIEYTNNRSLFYDAKILFMTLPSLFNGKAF